MGFKLIQFEIKGKVIEPFGETIASVGSDGEFSAMVNFPIDLFSSKDLFVFAHTEDADGNLFSSRLELCESQYNECFKTYLWTVGIGHTKASGPINLRFSIERPGATVWQSYFSTHYISEIQKQEVAFALSAPVLFSETFQLLSETSSSESEKPSVVVSMREMTIPESVKKSGVSGDENSEDVTFEIDRYYDGKDLSDKYWYVEVINGNGEYDIVSPPLTFDENKIYAIWTLNARQAYYPGDIQVRLRATDGDSFIWQSYTGLFNIRPTFNQNPTAPDHGLTYIDDMISKINQILVYEETGADDFGSVEDEIIAMVDWGNMDG
jgi:hypothetical protein